MTYSSFLICNTILVFSNIKKVKSLEFEEIWIVFRLGLMLLTQLLLWQIWDEKIGQIQKWQNQCLTKFLLENLQVIIILCVFLSRPFTINNSINMTLWHIHTKTSILEPEDVAEAIIFLLSDKSKMLNGITMPVDGGFCAV